MIEKFNARDIAMSKAIEECKLLIYCESEDIFGNLVYSNFYFHEFSSIISFCKALRKICRDISSEYEKFEYNFPKQISHENFVVIVDGWKRVKVENFPDTLNVSKHRDNIEFYFGKSHNDYH